MAWDAKDAGLQAFLAEISDHRILGRAEEAALARRVRKGDLQAREELIRLNMRLVLSIVQKSSGRGMEGADLIQEGILGLHTAIDKFDPELGYRLSTYATWWIRKAVQIGLAGAGADTIRLPPGVKQRRARALAAMTKYPTETLEQIAARIDEPPGLVRDALDAAAVVASIHGPTTEDDAISDQYHDPHADDPQDVGQEENAELLVALELLGPLERRVIGMRFGLEGEAMSVSEIAKEIGRPDHVVRDAQRKALDLLRSGMI